MPQRRFQPSLWVILLCIAAGCTSPAGTGNHLAIKPNTRPAQGGNLVSTGSAGIVANNSGGLTGTVLGPSAGIIANNAGSLISDRGSSLISNNGSGFRVLDASKLSAPLAAAQVVVLDAAGTPINDAVTTDAQGHYTIESLNASTPLVFVKASATADGQAITLLAAVAAPREKGLAQAPVDPASTLAAKKLLRMLAQNAIAAADVKPETIAAIARVLSPYMNERAVTAACLQPDDKASATFDAMLAQSASLVSALQALGPDAGPLIAQTPASPLPAPSPRPSTASSPVASTAASASPSPSASPGASPGPSASPGSSPTPSPSPRLLRIAGSTTSGSQEAAGDLTTATFGELDGIAVAADGTIYVTDDNNQTLRVLHPDTGTSAIVAGVSNTPGLSGDGGPAVNAKLKEPQGLALGPDGSLYVADSGNNRIRKIATDGTISTVVGGGAGTGDGAGTSLALNMPWGLAVGSDGNVYFSERNPITTTKARVCRLASSGNVTTVADNLPGVPGALSVDSAHSLLWFANANTLQVLRDPAGTPSAPVKVMTTDSTNPNMTAKFLGLANDGSGNFWALQATWDGSTFLGIDDAKLWHVSVDLTSGQIASGAAATVIAGTGGTSANPADYSVPTAGVLDPLTQLFAVNGLHALAYANGSLYFNDDYKDKLGTGSVFWSEVVRLKP